MRLGLMFKGNTDYESSLKVCTANTTAISTTIISTTASTTTIGTTAATTITATAHYKPRYVAQLALYTPLWTSPAHTAALPDQE